MPTDAAKPASKESNLKRFRRVVLPGLREEQRRMLMPSDATRTVLADVKAILQGFLSKLSPEHYANVRRESFEQAVQRLGVKEADLQRLAVSHKRAQWVLYLLAGLLFLYGLHIWLSAASLAAAGVWVASACAAVRGYLCAFRAWQIDNRNLLPLVQALRKPETYLVL